MNRGFELVARPNPIDLALLGLTGGFAAAHPCDVRQVEQMACLSFLIQDSTTIYLILRYPNVNHDLFISREW